MQSPYINDSCLEFLIKFRHLKALNLSGTQITPCGLIWILNTLSFTPGIGDGDNCTSLSMQLVSFGCKYPEQSHIDILAIGFKNLRSLRLSVSCQKICLSRLRELEYLSNFNLRFQ
jgi:hypothetical protein